MICRRLPEYVAKARSRGKAGSTFPATRLRRASRAICPRLPFAHAGLDLQGPAGTGQNWGGGWGCGGSGGGGGGTDRRSKSAVIISALPAIGVDRGQITHHYSLAVAEAL